MASEIQTYCYDGTKPITLVKWKIKKGGQLFYNSIILSYKQEDGNIGDGKEPLLKYKSNLGGTVSELIATEGDVINPGAPLLKIEPCTHPVIMKDLCAECGTDLRHLDRDNFEKLTAATTFSMVHVVPELKVSLEQAEKLGRDDEDRLLKNRKLVLLVDLDQTLIHTTNDNVPQNLPDVHHFQLYGPYSPWYHTNLRPGTLTFLENISKYCELHICTFGARLYAHKIAQILDPDGKLFSHRILSRDECFDATSKTGNLKALFPRGDDMVCIIDDREDVWNFAPNVIHVKPYSYFRNTGDINAPPPPPPPPNPKEAQSSQPTVNTPSSPAENSLPKADASPPPDKNGEDLKDSTKEETAKDPATTSGSDSSTSNEVADLKPPESDSKVDCSEPDKLQEKNGNTKTDSSENVANSKTSETNNAYVNAHNSDDYLLYLEEIIINVHKSYYEIYDKMKKEGKKGIPDMKVVVPYVRSKVLKGVRIVFSSVIPTNCVPESHHLWTLAESLGAQVSRELNFDRKQRTTHVVASKQGTAKVNAAKRHKGIHVVSLDWLLCCAERWEHADERLFPLAKDSQATPGENENSSFSYHDSVVVKSRLKRPHSSKKKQNDKEQQKKEDKFSERIFVEAGLSLSQDDIEDMDREVEAACSEESENEADNSASSDSSSTGESLSSGDYPRGWKKLKKCEEDEDIDDERDMVTSDSSDADTIGSVDEEIAEAVKQEFGNC
ncbi:RNA polymerase II subunit A C-terminal domain phosphatase [Araneus ventricosus]|uniref:RNA polymerase II subunit A C-terminal domain phosphatase n=1 Tax=Araneus ventricosus TaxID=182803 RepID=A0A4Y2M4A0_ARAVE|nr:RNA polymerase II subunit A C-terminal domain phosphatase [Araneus ventricosus]